MMAAFQSADALIATFGFGAVVITSLGCAALYLAGHALSSFRVCQRPVLIAFFTASALWAFTAFIATTVSQGDDKGCQIAVVFASLLDQIARITLAQFLLWTILDGPKSTKVGLALQSGVLVRLILGFVFTGFHSPQFDPVCVEKNEQLSLGVIILIFDACLLLVMFSTAYSAGLLDLEGKRESRNLALPVVMTGAGLWTATSTPMTLGLANIGLLSRTFSPSIGLLSLLVAIMLMKYDLSALCERAILPTEAATPVMTWRNNPFTRDIVSGHSSGSSSDSGSDDHVREDRRGWSAYYQPGTSIRSQLTRPTIRLVPDSIRRTSVLSRFLPQHEMVDGVAIRDVQKATSRNVRKGVKAGNLVISDPRAVGNHQSPGMETIDLEMAARNEWERRNRPSSVLTLEAFHPIPERRSSLMQASSPTNTQRPLSRVPRKPIGSLPKTRSQLEPVDELSPMGLSSSAQFSPGLEEVRRRSPRFPPLQTQKMSVARGGSLSTVREILETPCSFTHRSLPLLGLVQPEPDTPTASKHHTLQTDIPVVYELEGSTRYRDSMQLSQDLIERIESVVNRPRPVPRNDAGNGKIFLRDEGLRGQRHRRSLSVGSIRSKKSTLRSTPGSPSTLPPLPPVPKSAGILLGRSLGNAKGMSVEEKVSIFMSLIPRRGHDSVGSDHEEEEDRLSETEKAQERAISDTESRILPRSSNGSLRESFLTADVLHLSNGTLDTRGSRPARGDSSSLDIGGHGKKHQSIDALLNYTRNLGIRKTTSTSAPEHLGHASQNSTSSTSSSSSTWHHRIGDDLPAFSDRQSARLSRRLPPPPLNIPRASSAAVSAEPSPAPSHRSDGASDHALEMIDEQLRCLEEAEGGSTTTVRERRQTLLGSLEDEMNKHESKWEKLRMSYGRDSQSSFKTSPSRTHKAESPDLRHFPPVPSHNRASMTASIGSQRKGRTHSPDEKSKRWSSISHQTRNRHSITSASQQMNVPTPPDTDEDGSERGEDDTPRVVADLQVQNSQRQERPEGAPVSRALELVPGSDLTLDSAVEHSESSTKKSERHPGKDLPRLATDLGISRLVQPNTGKEGATSGESTGKMDAPKPSLGQDQTSHCSQEGTSPATVIHNSAPPASQVTAPRNTEVSLTNQVDERPASATNPTYRNLKHQPGFAPRRLPDRLGRSRPTSTYDSIPMLLDIASLSSPTGSNGPSSAPLLLEQQQYYTSSPRFRPREIPQQGRGRVQRQANIWDCYATGGRAAASGQSYSHQGSPSTPRGRPLSPGEIRAERRRRRASRTAPTCVSRFSVQRRPSSRTREDENENERR